jgi:hypothetical protein
VTYLDRVAEEIRRHVPDGVLPDGDTELLFRVYAVLLLAKGAAVTSADVHNAWTVWMQTSERDHEALVPFEALSAEKQASDEPYVEAIRAAIASHEEDAPV